MSLIEASNIRKTYGELQVLKGIDLSVEAGEFVAIIGPSGAGKTTLLQIIGLLEQPDKGASIRLDGEEVATLSAKKRAQYRNRFLGFVFQKHQLLPEFSALENVLLPALIKGTPKAKAEHQAKSLLERLGLADRINHRPTKLSGGEAQRVAVARALINEPKLILADEPSGSLDSHNREELYELFFSLRKELKQTFIVVTHDDSFAKRSDRSIYIQDGLIDHVETNL